MSADPLRRLPGAPRVVLHAAGGRRARHVRTLAGAADWRRMLADAAAFAPVAAFGPRLLPHAPTWPWPDAAVGDVEQDLRHWFPGIRVLGGVLPRQAGRRRLSLLCHAAGNPLVIKLGGDAPPLRAEQRALELLAADPLPGIATPRPLAAGVIGPASDPVAFVASTALGLGAQRPAVDEALRTFEADLAVRLRSLPRPADTPADHVPVHGDLTPWNLRRTGRGLALFDWESAGWGPPGSDLAHYGATSAEIRRSRRLPGGRR